VLGKYFFETLHGWCGPVVHGVEAPAVAGRQVSGHLLHLGAVGAGEEGTVAHSIGAAPLVFLLLSPHYRLVRISFIFLLKVHQFEISYLNSHQLNPNSILQAVSRVTSLSLLLK
jgi:hypothetical protein